MERDRTMERSDDALESGRNVRTIECGTLERGGTMESGRTMEMGRTIERTGTMRNGRTMGSDMAIESGTMERGRTMRRGRTYHPLLLPLGILLLGCLTTSTVTGSSNEVLGPEDPDAEDIRRFDNVIVNFMRERGIPGASVAISKNGQLLFRKGYGRGGAYRIVTPWSLFRIGSVSKPVTAMGILKLYEEGKLCLDAPVFGDKGLLRRFVPAPKGDERLLLVTVRHLLQHTAGWDQRLVGDPLLWRGLGKTMGVPEPANPDAVIGYMMTQPLQFNPGSRYAYSNLGYTVLGRIIEQVTGRGYEDYIQGILRYISIYSMKIGHTKKTEADFSEVEYYPTYPSSRVQSVYPKAGLVSPPYGGFCLENMDSTSGWIASAADLVTFLDALNSSHPRSLLKPETFSLMLEQPEHAHMGSWYGMGVVVQDGGRTWWHSGTLDGSTSVLTHDEMGFTWAVLLNYRLDNNDLDDLVKYAIRKVSYWRLLPSLPAAPLADSIISSNGVNLAKIMIPEHKFHHVFKMISSSGFRLSWIEGFTTDEGVFFNTIWRKSDGMKWKAYFGLKSSGFRRRYKSKVAQGYRLAHVDTYVSGKRLRYAAVFLKDQWPAWVSYHGYSPHRHRHEFYKLLREGFRLVSQSVTEYRGRLYVAALYDKLNLGPFRVRMGLSPEQFVSESEKQVRSGRVLSYIQAYTHRGLVKFSTIWTVRTTPVWAARHDMTKYTLLNKLYEYAEVDVPVTCITGYQEDEHVKFAGLWR